MKEQDFLKIIESKVGQKFIGDDCAYIKDLGIIITQDSFIEDVHFKRNWYTPHELGYKAMAVNISDILAGGGKPKYATVGLSLPNDIDEEFVEEFYEGLNSASLGAEIIGGDITGSKKGIFISITVIGSDKGRNISSRKNDLYYKNQELSNLERRLTDLENDYNQKKKDYDAKKIQIEKEEEKIKNNKKEINNLNIQLKAQKEQIDQLNTEIENSGKKTEILNKNLIDVMKESKLQMQYMEELQNKIMNVMKKIALKKNITL